MDLTDTAQLKTHKNSAYSLLAIWPLWWSFCKAASLKRLVANGLRIKNRFNVFYTLLCSRFVRVRMKKLT